MPTGTVIDKYFVGQGDAALYQRDALGKRLGGRLIGNCTAIKLKGTQQELIHREGRTGFRGVDNKIPWEPRIMLSLQFDSFSKENLAWLFDGVASTAAGGGAVAEIQAYAPIMQLDNSVGITSVTAKKTGAASNWTADTFSVTSSGLVTILTDPPAAGVALGDPIEFSYAYGVSEQVTALNAPNLEYWFSSHIINKANQDKRRVFDAFRVKFMQNYEWDLIGNNYGALSIEGELLLDSTKSAFGGYFRERAAV
jgi:hypothetical protein